MSRVKLPSGPWAGALRALFPRQALTPEERARTRELAERALRILTPREEKVLRERFGLMTPEAKTRLGDTSVTEGTARERIRQIEARALRKLRHPSRSRRPPGAL